MLAVERCTFRRKNGRSERVYVFGNSAMQTWRDGRSKRAVQDQCIVGSFVRVMRRNVSMEIKRFLRNILLQTFLYGSETWTWNRAQQSRLPAGEMSYLRGACEGDKMVV